MQNDQQLRKDLGVATATSLVVGCVIAAASLNSCA